jgi:hypothetical protein
MCPHTTEPYIFTTQPFLFLAVSCRQREATQAYNTLPKKKKHKKLQAAERLYLRALLVDSGHVATLCNYAYLSATMQAPLSRPLSLAPFPVRARALSLQLRLALWDHGGSIDSGSCAPRARLLRFVASSSLSLPFSTSRTNKHTHPPPPLSLSHTHTHIFFRICNVFCCCRTTRKLKICWRKRLLLNLRTSSHSTSWDG